MIRLPSRNNDLPACADCAHYGCGDNGKVCYNEKCSTFDLVDGREPIQAKSARGPGGPCGLQGRYFEKRKPPSPWPARYMLLILFGVGVGYFTRMFGLW